MNSPLLEKKPEEIIAVQGADFSIPVEDFWRLADTDYDCGYGSQEVASDLKLIGADFWLERHEYDGAERWAYYTFPKIDKPMKFGIKALTTRQSEEDTLWCTLANINGIKDKAFEKGFRF